MTPFMPEKYLNPDRPAEGVMNPTNDVEMKNALAVKTAKVVYKTDRYAGAARRACARVLGHG